MKKLLLLLILILYYQNIIFSQTIDTIYTQKYLNKSTSFAWTTFGGDLLILGGGSSSYIDYGTAQKINFNPTLIPRLTIGGIHFWGHTDFYVSFPLTFFSSPSYTKKVKVIKKQKKN